MGEGGDCGGEGLAGVNLIRRTDMNTRNQHDNFLICAPASLDQSRLLARRQREFLTSLWP
jgi:hypothetical protein